MSYTFDTNNVVHKMENTGIEREQAEMIVMAIKEATKGLATSQDLQNVYVRIDAMESKSDARFEAMMDKLEAMEIKSDARFEVMEDKLEAMEIKSDGRFEAMEDKLETMESKSDGRFEAMKIKSDGKFDVMESKFEARINAQTVTLMVFQVISTSLLMSVLFAALKTL